MVMFHSYVSLPEDISPEDFKMVELHPAQALRLPFWFPITVPLGVIMADGTYLVNPDKSQPVGISLPRGCTVFGRHWVCNIYIYVYVCIYIYNYIIIYGTSPVLYGI